MWNLKILFIDSIYASNGVFPLSLFITLTVPTPSVSFWQLLIYVSVTLVRMEDNVLTTAPITSVSAPPAGVEMRVSWVSKILICRFNDVIIIIIIIIIMDTYIARYPPSLTAWCMNIYYPLSSGQLYHSWNHLDSLWSMQPMLLNV